MQIDLTSRTASVTGSRPESAAVTAAGHPSGILGVGGDVDVVLR